MSFLAPLFLLGGLAIGLPVLFHLIRRQPQGRISFSSLMFLEASPPRLSRKSRLDDWLLLLIRVLAILLIAIAFMRPFLRSEAAVSVAPADRYSVVLVDRSASMRRGDLWQQAIDAAAAAAGDVRPTDRVAWATFDSAVQVVQGFGGSPADLAGSAAGHAADAGAAVAAIRELEPSWRAGDLGRALTTAADLIEEATREADASDVERTVVLISDLQAGSTLAALRGYEWPESTRLKVVRVAGEPSSNATIAAAGPAADPTGQGEQERADGFRVSVSNAADSKVGQFSLRWIGADGLPVAESPTSVTVPPGTTRATRLQPPAAEAMAIELSGDDQAFDNRRFVAVPIPLEQTVLFVGSDVEDPRKSLLYYLQRVALDRPGRTVSVRPHATAEPLASALPGTELAAEQVPLIVLAEPPSTALLEELERYLSGGGRVLMVITSAAASDAATQQAAQQLSRDPGLRITPADVDDYALMTRIDFTSPLFEPLADPRFSDFTKIQFWSHQHVTVGEEQDWKTLTRFDDGDPALLERRVDEGKLWILAAGWQPAESQLALSSKFVPIIAGMARDVQREELSLAAVVGEPWALPASKSAEITTPDGRSIAYRSPEDARSIDAPGIYRYRDSGSDHPVAVNLAPGESQTEPLDLSLLEQLGVRFADQQSAERKANAERQLRDVELERSQQWWRVLLLAGLAMLGIETLLSSRSRAATIGSAAPNNQRPSEVS